MWFVSARFRIREQRNCSEVALGFVRNRETKKCVKLFGLVQQAFFATKKPTDEKCERKKGDGIALVWVLHIEDECVVPSRWIPIWRSRGFFGLWIIYGFVCEEEPGLSLKCITDVGGVALFLRLYSNETTLFFLFSSACASWRSKYPNSTEGVSVCVRAWMCSTKRRRRRTVRKMWMLGGQNVWMGISNFIYNDDRIVKLYIGSRK